MESAGYLPMRAVVRCKAKQRLLQMQDELETDERFDTIDEHLFKEIASTLFQSDRYQSLYHAYRSKREALAVEDQLAAELVEIYQTIALQQQNTLVQRLNALL